MLNPALPVASAAWDRHALAALMVDRLRRGFDAFRASWSTSRPVRHCIIDDLLPLDAARAIATAFPTREVLMQRSSLRERKRVGISVEIYDPLVVEALFAFQESALLTTVQAMTGLQGMEADPSLYASGLSLMEEGGFLNPHLDNSHDGDQERYRALNLLYYVSPEWQTENGGHLELWDTDVQDRMVVECRFNRLVLMETNDKSWHSVSKVVVPSARHCISNYYFTQSSPTQSDYRHVTTFAGRPEEGFKRVALGLDGLLLNTLGRLFPALLGRSRHRRKSVDGKPPPERPAS